MFIRVGMGLVGNHLAYLTQPARRLGYGQLVPWSAIVANEAHHAPSINTNGEFLYSESGPQQGPEHKLHYLLVRLTIIKFNACEIADPQMPPFEVRGLLA